MYEGDDREGQEVADLPVYDDGPDQDVDIEITEEDLGERLEDFDLGDDDGDGESEEGDAEAAEPEEESDEEDAEPEVEEIEERPKRREQNRIAELSRRAQEAERRAQEYEQKLQQEAMLRQQADIAMMTHYEQRLSTQARTLKAQLQEAMVTGDTERQIDLQTELMQVQNDLSGVEHWKRQQQAQAQAQVQEPEARQVQQPTQPPQVNLDPTTAEWIQNNTWFQPQSPDFDPEMHEEATLYARRIERRYKAEGREADIGSLEYFTEIDRYVRSEFPDAFGATHAPKRAAPPMSRKSPVAPVNRAAPEGQSPKNSKTIRLTADQRRLAHQLAESGAVKKPNGARMTPAEAERYYAVQMMKQNRR